MSNQLCQGMLGGTRPDIQAPQEHSGMSPADDFSHSLLIGYTRNLFHSRRKSLLNWHQETTSGSRSSMPTIALARSCSVRARYRSAGRVRSHAVSDRGSGESCSIHWRHAKRAMVHKFDCAKPSSDAVHNATPAKGSRQDLSRHLIS